MVQLIFRLSNFSDFQVQHVNFQRGVSSTNKTNETPDTWFFFKELCSGLFFGHDDDDDGGDDEDLPRLSFPRKSNHIF